MHAQTVEIHTNDSTVTIGHCKEKKKKQITK